MFDGLGRGSKGWLDSVDYFAFVDCEWKASTFGYWVVVVSVVVGVKEFLEPLTELEVILETAFD